MWMPNWNDDLSLEDTKWEDYWRGSNERWRIAGAVAICYNTYGMKGVYAFRERNTKLAGIVDAAIKEFDLANNPEVGTLEGPEGWEDKSETR